MLAGYPALGAQSPARNSAHPREHMVSQVNISGILPPVTIDRVFGEQLPRLDTGLGGGPG